VIVFVVIARELGLILIVGVVLAAGYGIGHWHARHLAARNRPRSLAGTQPREPEPVRNARSLAQQLRHARGQVETLTGKLADEMSRNDRSQI
jgi:hypothetical protein